MNKKQKLWMLLVQIPRGKVTTYKTLAEKLGTHPRAVGKMLNSNPRPVVVPCHRVVRSGGWIGGYKFGTKKKTELLDGEGVEIKNGKICFDKFLFNFK